MYKGRGKRGSSSSSKRSSSVMKILFIPRNLEQEERTLGLIGVVGDKPHVNDLMEVISERLEREEMRKMSKRMAYGYDEGYLPFWDDERFNDCDDDYDFGDIVGCLSPKELRKLNKRYAKNERKRGRGKNSRRGLYEGDEDDFWNHRHSMYPGLYDNDSEGIGTDKVIKFYDDIENEMSVREFDSLKDFEIFCTQEGYEVGTTDYNNLLNWDEIHCCLDPIDLEYGSKAVITDNSYGALYWTVSDNITKMGINPVGGESHRML